MKLVYTLIFVSFSFVAFGQQQAGDLSIQFSGNYISQKYRLDNVTYKSFVGNVYVKIGKFFTPNIELGLKPNVFFSPKTVNNPKNPDDPQKKYKVKTSVGLGLYGTYSFLTADAKFMPYAGAEVNYLPTGDGGSLNLGPYAGVKYFLTEKINIDANINYSINLASSYGNDFKDVYISPTFLFNVGVGVLISKATE